MLRTAKHLIVPAAVVLLLILCTIPAFAGEYPQYQDKYVNDFADITLMLALREEHSGERTEQKTEE